MFKSIRTTAGLAAIAAVAATAAAGVASPPAAEAASYCRYYKVPTSLEVRQGNGWTVKTGARTGKYKWQVSAWPNGRPYTKFGTLRLTRFDTTASTKSKVEFTVTLSNGNAGFYSGTINSRGFIKGWTEDEFNDVPTDSFRVMQPVECG